MPTFGLIGENQEKSKFSEFRHFLSKNTQKTITEKTVQMTEIGGKITEIPGTESSPFFMVLNVFFAPDVLTQWLKRKHEKAKLPV
jgi:hypothetical protein